MSVILFGTEKFEDVYKTLKRREIRGRDSLLFYAGVYQTFGDMNEMDGKLQILIQSLCDMNQEAYAVRYRDHSVTEANFQRVDFTKGKDYCSDAGLLKSLQSIRYNSIEAEDGPRPKQFKPIMDKLNEIIGKLAEHIVGQLPEYEAAMTW